MSAIVISVVRTASRTDRASDEVNPGWLITEPKALIPANRSAAHSGSRKYTAATMRTVQRQMVLARGATPRNPPRLGGPIPPDPPCELAQPFSRPPLHRDVDQHRDRDDDHHAQAERLADVLLAGDDVAVQERPDLDRGQRDGP